MKEQHKPLALLKQELSRWMRFGQDGDAIVETPNTAVLEIKGTLPALGCYSYILRVTLQ